MFYLRNSFTDLFCCHCCWLLPVNDGHKISSRPESTAVVFMVFEYTGRYFSAVTGMPEAVIGEVGLGVPFFKFTRAFFKILDEKF